MVLNLHVQAQSNQKISLLGIVNDRKPIEGAHCYLKNNGHLGSVTDSSGFFRFGFQQTLLYDTLVISAIGYEQKEVPLFSVNIIQDTNYFALKQNTIILDEVLVETKGYNLKDLFLGAFANIPKNYPNKPHQLKGLYRKVGTEDTQYTHLEEAVITLEDKGYNKPPVALKIGVEAFRETKEWGKIDSLDAQVFNKMNTRISHALNQAANPIAKSYLSNFIRYHRDENKFFNLKRMQKIIDEYYTLEIMDISILEGDTIYKIAFESSIPPPPPEHASGRNFLKINSKDLAIVEMQFTLGFADQPLISQNHVIFEEKYGKYYPKYIKRIIPRFINQNFDDNEYDIYTIWFDEVKVGKFKKIKLKDLNDPDDPQSYKRTNLSPEFWKDASLVKKYPLEEGIRKDLEKHQPLEEQFQESSQK